MTLTSNGLKWDTRNLLDNIEREESKLGLSTFEILENYNYTHKWNYINYMKSELYIYSCKHTQMIYGIRIIQILPT